MFLIGPNWIPEHKWPRLSEHVAVEGDPALSQVHCFAAQVLQRHDAVERFRARGKEPMPVKRLRVNHEHSPILKCNPCSRSIIALRSAIPPW